VARIFFNHKAGISMLYHFYSPQLDIIHRGKVRDSIRVDNKSRMIIVTDRISAFNKNLENAIPDKGAVLNKLTNWWFDFTKDIIPNHFIKEIDPNINLVQEAKPIKLEMIVRAYITGSMWRGYEEGQRVFCGVAVPDGLKKNDPFPTPIITPTTKDKDDSEITEKEIFERKLTSKAVFKKMKETALALFKRGSDHLAEKGIILVDTKYEFGMLGRKLILIDEIHTPDSSRFWSAADYKKNPRKAEQIDKEFVRQWMLKNKVDGVVPSVLSKKVTEETSRRYKQIYETITGLIFDIPVGNQKARIYQNLVAHSYIKHGYVAIIQGDDADLDYCKKIETHLKDFQIHTEFRRLSAAYTGQQIIEFSAKLNSSLEPAVVIVVTGRSNSLGSAVAANLNCPVISCPSFSDRSDYLINIHSSLQHSSSAMTVMDPQNAAYSAIKSLNVPELRSHLSQKIAQRKSDLMRSDETINS